MKIFLAHSSRDKQLAANVVLLLRLLNEAAFQNAVHCLATYRWHSTAAPQLAIIWSGIEGLFGVDTEPSFRVSLYCARFWSQTIA
jgi:hypothetical protein